MIFINPAAMVGFAPNSELAAEPASNLLAESPRLRWSAALATDAFAWFDFTNTGYANAVVLHQAVASNVSLEWYSGGGVWMPVSGQAATVYTDPRWPGYTTHWIDVPMISGTVKLRLVAAQKSAGVTISAAQLAYGLKYEMPVVYPLSEGIIGNDIVTPLLNGEEYRRPRVAGRVFSGLIRAARADADVAALRALSLSGWHRARMVQLAPWGTDFCVWGRLGITQADYPYPTIAHHGFELRELVGR